MRKKTECDVSFNLRQMKGKFHFKREYHPYTVVKQDDDDVWGDGDFDEAPNEDKAVGLWGSFWINIASSVFFAGMGYVASLIWPLI
jgi:hypothetical protein